MKRNLTPIALATALCSLSCNGSPPASQGKTGQRNAPSPAAPSAAPNAETPAAVGTGAESSGEPGAAPRVALDAEPRIDLLYNRFFFHLVDEGLLIPIASEGLRKYTQEYIKPWGEVVTVDGRPGRVLERDRATLRVPWDGDGQAFVRARMNGVASGQSLIVEINGKRAGVAKVDDGWQIVTVPVKAGLLHAGENSMLVRATKRGTAAGKRTYGLFHSLEIVSGDATETERFPALSPAKRVEAGGSERAALAGFRKLFDFVEIPPQAWLEVQTGAVQGTPHFLITATTVDGKTRTLVDATADEPGWTPHLVSLAELANRLVRLELSIEGDPDSGAWGEPSIRLAAAPERERPAPYQNAILLVVDAMRADRLKLYADTRVETPRITKEGEARGVVFLRNQGASPSSPPAHASIQTGMTPRRHGVAGDKSQLTPGTPMLSTQLRDAGISAGYYGNNSFGMGRLKKPGRWTAYHEPNREGKGIDCGPLMEGMLDFAKTESEAGHRFVVSSLPYETHVPYRFHEGISDKYYPGPWKPPVGKSVGGEFLGAIVGGKVHMSDSDWKQLKALYDGEVEHFDGCFGQLLDGLDKLGLRQKTAVLLASDHGEGMFEHGRMGHAFGHYAELANVPLVLFADGLVDKGIGIDTVTSQLDIVPTILDLLGVKADERVQGRSLLPLILRKGPWTPRVVPLEYGRSYALRARRWKYIVDYHGNESLFDLENDPTEQKELGDSQPMALRYMRELAGFYLAHRKDWRMSTWGPLNNHGRGFIEYVGAPLLRAEGKQ